MSEEREFRDKWRARIDGCGPYCSCLIIIVILTIIVLAFLIRGV
jgi:hypothetical protein